MWHPSHHGSLSPQLEAFNHWLECKDLSLILEMGVPTHNCGNVLDLVFGSSQLVARGTLASVQQDQDVTSDHLPLLVTMYCVPRASMPKTINRFATIDEEKFQISLLAQLADISPLTNPALALTSQLIRSLTFSITPTRNPLNVLCTVAEDSSGGTRAARRRGRNTARKSGKALLLEPTG
ncbi:hypothetical protein K3495_g9132 [Podosphaera aphanis]|nr:hypothetical protein K3495_g9132 [Podosphaera aphanis]